MKKIIALAIATMLMVTMVPQETFAVSGTDTWDGKIDLSWYEKNPAATEFTITTAEELAGLADIVNGTATGISADTFDGKTITLSNNLDLAGKEWTPIGVHAGSGTFMPFLGTFDGGNHSISNMKIDRDTPNAGASGADDYLGLFGVASDTVNNKAAILKNLSVLNVSVKGDNTLGGLVGGISGGEINNCHVSGKLIGENVLGGLVGLADESTIKKSSSSVEVSGTESVDASDVGGLVGNGTVAQITECYATGTVTGTTDVGGLVGYGVKTRITECYATGDVTGTINVGGLVGNGIAAGPISCYATGDVTGTDIVGGLVGLNGTVEADTGVSTNSYATGIVSASAADANVGGLLGHGGAGYVAKSSFGNNENFTNKNGVNGSFYILEDKPGATLEQMQTEAFKNKLNNGDSTVLEPFARDPEFNNGVPYLATIPQIMSGDGQTIKQGEPLTIKATMPYVEGIVNTKVDGVDVPAGMVTYASGSTIVTLSEEYTANLGVGTYSIEIANLDYGMVRGTFTVAAVDPVPTPEPVPAPETGDNTNAYGLIAAAIISILGAYVVARRRNRV